MNGEVGTPMPKYVCHKTVWALKIRALNFRENGDLEVIPEDEGYAPFEVPEKFVPKHRPGIPQPGWYYVVYENGYRSFSPADVFESGYSPIAPVANGAGNNFSYPQIASVCHEANRAYCETLGDKSQLQWEDAPEWQKASAISGVVFHIRNLMAGVDPKPSASHDAWLETKRADGWKYGPVKDAEKKEHPCFVPYDQLPVEQRLNDFIFAAIVKAFWESR